MNTQWTAQDVERFREQQRWRLRQKTHFQVAPFALSQTRPLPASSNVEEPNDRQRKVSVKFRLEHQQFVAKERMLPSQCPHLSTPEATTRPKRPAFSIVLPSSIPRRTAESPLPHMAHSMFNAFDSVASPEAFVLERHSNQDEEFFANMKRSSPLRVDSDEDQDIDMSDGEESECGSQTQDESLWRRRIHMQRMGKKSPKLGRVALWDGDATNNQVMELTRVSLPFARDADDDL